MTSGNDIFGTRIRTKTLLLISALRDTHVREIAAILGVSVNSIRNAVKTLESAGVTVGRMVGKTRILTLNPKFRASNELNALLEKLVAQDKALLQTLESRRRRPRKVGKEI